MKNFSLVKNRICQVLANFGKLHGIGNQLFNFMFTDMMISKFE